MEPQPHRSILRRTAQTPCFLGYLLARWRRHAEASAEEQARRLGLTPDGLSRLCLCYAPRAERWQEDVERCARHVGADVAELRRMLLPPTEEG
jgi:hypothetical protein